MMARIYSITIIVAANVLIPLAALTFVKGFFPHKPFFPGQAQYPDDGKPIPPAPFDKVIFMVVDALRRSAGEYMKQMMLILAVILSILPTLAFNLLRGQFTTENQSGGD